MGDSGSLITGHHHDAKAGVVKDIVTEDGKVQDTVKHTLDGKQPTLKRVPIEAPIPLKEL